MEVPARLIGGVTGETTGPLGDIINSLVGKVGNLKERARALPGKAMDAATKKAIRTLKNQLRKGIDKSGLPDAAKQALHRAVKNSPDDLEKLKRHIGKLTEAGVGKVRTGVKKVKEMPVGEDYTVASLASKISELMNLPKAEAVPQIEELLSRAASATGKAAADIVDLPGKARQGIVGLGQTQVGSSQMSVIDIAKALAESGDISTARSVLSSISGSVLSEDAMAKLSKLRKKIRRYSRKANKGVKSAATGVKDFASSTVESTKNLPVGASGISLADAVSSLISSGDVATTKQVLAALAGSALPEGANKAIGKGFRRTKVHGKRAGRKVKAVATGAVDMGKTALTAVGDIPVGASGLTALDTVKALVESGDMSTLKSVVSTITGSAVPQKVKDLPKSAAKTLKKKVKAIPIGASGLDAESSD